MAELPPHWMLDDWEQYASMVDPPLGDHIEPTRKALEIWTAELDAMRGTASLLVLTCHPLLSGRPSRARHRPAHRVRQRTGRRRVRALRRRRQGGARRAAGAHGAAVSSTPQPTSRAPTKERCEEMTDHKKTLLGWIDEERDELIGLFSAFIRARSPNPPGDTREAVAFICRTLDERQLPYRLIAPQPEMANVVGTFECGGPGRHLVLNGHIDVYPVGDEKWSHDPWGGEVVDGRVYGRGSCDMKAGTMASISSPTGTSTACASICTAVSPSPPSRMRRPWGRGARATFMENHPEVHGDCLLNGEPSSPFSLRFGEKGLLWLAFTVATPGAHGAYTHMSPSATKIAAKLIEELEAVTQVEPSPPPEVAAALADVEAATERAQGPGAYRTMQVVTLNIGTIQGGLKVNMTPGICRFEADIRLPVGLTKEPVMAIIDGSWSATRRRASRRSITCRRAPATPAARWCASSRPTSRSCVATSGAEREHRRYRRPPVALPRHPRDRLRRAADEHGAGRRARRGRGVPPHRAHTCALGVRLPEPHRRRRRPHEDHHEAAERGLPAGDLEAPAGRPDRPGGGPAPARGAARRDEGGRRRCGCCSRPTSSCPTRRSCRTS